MTRFFFRRLRPLQKGFSLLEMLIAVMFIGILTAGMFRVYSSNLAGFQRLNDIIGSQRRGRWALASMQDDVASIGYFAMVPAIQPPVFPVGPGLQEPFMVLPSPTPVVVTGPNPASPGNLLTAPLLQDPANRVEQDELQFISDIPLPIQATVQAGALGSLTLNVSSGSTSDIRAGDSMIVMDENSASNQLTVANAPSNNVIDTSVSPLYDAEHFGSMGPNYSTGGTGTYVANTPVLIYRHNVVTRYAIQARSWDPANAAITIPCLVRQQAPYLGSALVDWAAVNVTTDVIAENIDSLRVDLSFDGGNTWLRQGAANWEALVARIDAALGAYTTGATPSRSDPLWFRKYPVMVRLDATSRSAAPRAGNAAVAGQADYVHRTQTLMITPRNFGYSTH